MLPTAGISFERFEFHPLCGQVNNKMIIASLSSFQFCNKLIRDAVDNERVHVVCIWSGKLYSYQKKVKRGFWKEMSVATM